MRHKPMTSHIAGRAWGITLAEADFKFRLAVDGKEMVAAGQNAYANFAALLMSDAYHAQSIERVSNRLSR